MHSVFQRVRAGRIEVQIPGERVAEEADPWIRANSAAFLILERERRAAAARLGRHYWRRGDRYRDLALVTRLTHLEYEHLAGRVSRKAGGPSPAAGRPALERRHARRLGPAMGHQADARDARHVDPLPGPGQPTRQKAAGKDRGKSHRRRGALP